MVDYTFTDEDGRRYVRVSMNLIRGAFKDPGTWEGYVCPRLVTPDVHPELALKVNPGDFTKFEDFWQVIGRLKYERCNPQVGTYLAYYSPVYWK